MWRNETKRSQRKFQIRIDQFKKSGTRVYSDVCRILIVSLRSENYLWLITDWPFSSRTWIRRNEAENEDFSDSLPYSGPTSLPSLNAWLCKSGPQLRWSIYFHEVDFLSWICFPWLLNLFYKTCSCSDVKCHTAVIKERFIMYIL